MNRANPEIPNLKYLFSHFQKKTVSLHSKKHRLSEFNADRDLLSFHIEKEMKGKTGTVNLIFDAQIRLNDFISVMGKSGAGKTSLLRMLCGLLTPDSGYIRFGSEEWYDSSTDINLPPQKRRAGLVFQDYALFPNMTVLENLKFAAGRNNIQLVNELIELTGLEICANQYPDTLSGGQAQRAALARAVVNKPRLLLLDEPMAALDSDTRKLSQEVIISIHNRFAITSILVTHDLSDAFRLSNKLMKIENGKIASFDMLEKAFAPEMNTKFTLHGIITSIEINHASATLTVYIDNSLTKIIIPAEEVAIFHPGDHVLLPAKIYNPVVITF
jgi:molybdate transport system ATP-binding protein